MTPLDVTVCALGIAAGIVATAAGIGVVMFLYEQADTFMRERRYARDRERQRLRDEERERQRAARQAQLDGRPNPFDIPGNLLR